MIVPPAWAATCGCAGHRVHLSWALREPGMSRHRLSTACAAGLLLLGPLRAQAGSIPQFGIALGQYGFRNEIPRSLGIDLEIRTPWSWKWFRPVAGVVANSTGGAYLYSGIVFDVPLPGRFHLTPGFAPGVILFRGTAIWARGSSSGPPWRFRSRPPTRCGSRSPSATSPMRA